MGQKVNPILLRIGLIKNWDSRWFAKPSIYAQYVQEDYKIRSFIKKRLKQAAVSKIIIERLADRVRITIYSARPGIIIGRHGSDIERLREDLNNVLEKEFAIDIKEVKEPPLEAQLVAENVALQLERRIPFRRAVKRAIENSMSNGAKGIKICCAGRLNGAEMSRTETYKQGKVPLATFRADIDYGFAEAYTTYGLIGIKVWLYKGDILEKKPLQTEAQQETKKPEK